MWAIGLCALVACGAGPVKAHAGLKIPLPGRSNAEFALRGSHGYKVEVTAEGKGPISLVAARATASAAYRVPGGLSPSVMRTRFGRLGRIDVRFVPDGRVRLQRPRRGCRGKRSTERFGRFVGRIRFTGEGRYTTVRAASAPGSVTRTPRRVCSIGALTRAHGSEAEQEVEFSAVDVRGGRVLLARRPLNDKSRTPAVFVAARTEHRGRMEISRFVFSRAGHRDFQVDTALTTAALSPPLPFAGTGRFETRPDGSTSWTGDLRASFPGAPDVPFTGRTLRARLGPGEGF
jgi:hypothetical protein